MNQSALRRHKTYLASTHPRGTPFSNPTTLTSVFKADADHFKIARERIEMGGHFCKGWSEQNILLQMVRRLQWGGSSKRK